MKIGIYLGYAPARNMSLKKDGLGRYLAYILKGLSEGNNEVVIACPKWVIPAIEELCDEHDIDDNKMELLTSHTDSVIFRIFMYFLNKKIKEKKRRRKIKYTAVCFIDKIIDWLLNISSIVLFLCTILAALAICVLISPVLIGVGILYVVIQQIMHILKVERICRMLRPKTMAAYLIQHGKVAGHLYKKYFVEREFLVQVREKAVDDIISQISRMKDSVDVWYSPTAFWPEFNRISGKRVVCAPDIVTSDFAINFSSHIYGNASIQTEEVRKTLLNGQYFITYCEFIKKDLLIGRLNKKAENVIAIPHAVNDMSTAIGVDKCYENRINGQETGNLLARKILETVKENVLEQNAYLSEKGRCFSFSDVEYIFYASQVRGNKNFLTLIKAYQYLLRELKIPVKLFLTGNIRNDPHIYEYVKRQHLQFDVISFPGVSNQQLGALYKCAKLIVNPTLYEGGFNFTFGEGMSVGTPSIMGNIPQVTEVIQGYGLKEYFYDPYNYIDMAEKIAYGLTHIQEIYRLELKLFHDLSGRTWTDVGKEYIQAFKYFIEMDGGNKGYE
ncbi:hypothetical protein C823_003318 [Eubacterium plexicaudatum ASF492]|uniref:Glycosyl transferase family 1 domain-containing protein n=1 Tax=Eubacterium plexicaudatum ASF492 TaxID=1235802 RepID=N2ATH4_9FIRM|nr:hypothetical protein C823_003318 [Eubacterium plexicaudatum ASF492]